MNIDTPVFDASQVGELIDERPSVVRDWRDRGLSQFVGTKLDHLVEYSLRETVIVAIARDLIRLGFPLRMAALSACALLEEVPLPGATFRGTPNDVASLMPRDASSVLVHREMLRPPDVGGAEIVLHIGDVWHRTVDRATALAAEVAA